MQYRRLGRSGLQLSALSFGSWVTFGTQLDVGHAERMLGICLDAGVNFFDNAEGYNRGQSERIMGQALQKLAVRRDSYCVSSKVFFGSVEDPSPLQRGLCRKHIFDACHQALKRFRLNYLDLYFCHRPDPETPIEETVRAMHDLVAQGKVMYWGTSEWSVEELRTAFAVAEKHHLTPPTMEQPQYNLLDRRRLEGDYEKLYADTGLGTTVWSPLGSGALTGKYLTGVPQGSRADLPGYEWLRKLMVEGDRGQQRMEKVSLLKAVVDDAGLDMAQASIAWCLKNPLVSTVILGASSEQQLRRNLATVDVAEQLDDALAERMRRACA